MVQKIKLRKENLAIHGRCLISREWSILQEDRTDGQCSSRVLNLMAASLSWDLQSDVECNEIVADLVWPDKQLGFWVVSYSWTRFT